MELQEDIYRLQEILPDLTPTEIVSYFNTQCNPSKDSETRCVLALRHFVARNERKMRVQPNFEEEISADYHCLKHIFKYESEEKLRTLLTVLGTIPNRKLLASKLLLFNQNFPLRKRKSDSPTEEDPQEATSSKLIKIDSTESLDAEPISTSWKAMPGSSSNKLVLKRDRNANELRVPPTTPPKELQLKIPKRAKNSFFVQHPIINGVNKHHGTKRKEEVSSTSSSSVVSKSSQRVDDAQPGPSRIPRPQMAVLPDPQPDVVVDTEDESDVMVQTEVEPDVVVEPEVEPEPMNLDVPVNLAIPVIDLSTSNSSTATVELNDTATGPEENPSTEEPIPPVAVEPAPAPPAPPLPVDERLVSKVMEMFEYAQPDFIRKICAGRTYSENNCNYIVDLIFEMEDYPKRESEPSPGMEPEEQLNFLISMLPDADPTFLEEKLDQLGGDEEAFRRFVNEAVEKKDYPTQKDYERRQKLFAQQRQYTTEFNVERFVELFPDPEAVFEDPKRKTTILDKADIYYVKLAMRNKYKGLYAKQVNETVEKLASQNVVSIVKHLEEIQARRRRLKSKYDVITMPDSHNIPLLQELAYFQHKTQILKFLENKKEREAQEREDAKILGLFQTCSLCGDEEIMVHDILTCTGGCRFCRDCIRRGIEVAFGEGKLNFPCFSLDCDAIFSLQVLQSALPPKLFSKLAQKKAVAEVKAAGIEDLEMCPFCDFANIPAPEDKLFRCLNPDCMKESCRTCKEPSHVPLRCEEVEKDEAVKARTYIEDQMTEALVRECWKCGAKFIKEEGCNKMTCPCGASMCYICRKPVKDYKHFNGQGGDQFHLCPLYTDNFSVNEKNVLKAAAQAKKEVDSNQLINDPTKGLEAHFAPKIKQAKEWQKQQQQRAQAEQIRHLAANLQYYWERDIRHARNRRPLLEAPPPQVLQGPRAQLLPPQLQALPPLQLPPPVQVPAVQAGNHHVQEPVQHNPVHQ